MDTGLRDKVVLVTGAAGGIGRATAIAFAREGARVVGWDVRDDDAEDLLRELEEAGRPGRFDRVDVADGEVVEEALGRLIEAWGGVDVLVNNAGILRDAQLVKHRDGDVVSRMEEGDFDRVLEVNLKGVFLCARAVVPSMIERGGGVILQASSVVGLYGNFGQTNYTASKAGVIAMTKTWARELGRHGIRVNAVAPGFVTTEMALSVPEKIRRRMVDATPLGRLGKPEDVADAYVWLASDRAQFVHGTVLSVDGGLVVGT